MDRHRWTGHENQNREKREKRKKDTNGKAQAVTAKEDEGFETYSGSSSEAGGEFSWSWNSNREDGFSFVKANLRYLRLP